jgi:hypothetical protein
VRHVRATAALVVLLLVPAAARAESRACLDRASPRWVGRTQLGLSLVPFGAEVQARVAACMPLYPRAGDWFDLAMLEVGAMTAISPVYAAGGGYVTLTPSNVLAVRFEALGIGYWPLPLEGAGYYALPTADTPRDPATTLAVERGGAATGFTLRVLTTLQANIDVGPLAVLVQNTSMAEHTEIGSGAYFVNLQIDHTQRRDDLVFGNDAVLALEIPSWLTRGPVIRVGGYDSFRAVVASGSEGNQAGGLAVLGWSHPLADLHWLEVGLRAGGYTDHPLRTGELTVAAWCALELDLGDVAPGQRPE